MSMLMDRSIDPNSAKMTVDDYLNAVDYTFLNDGSYQPSVFALEYVNFIKLINGEEGESHPSPVVHMAMLDKLATRKKRLANLCARGMSKTTLFGEYLPFYVAIFGGIPGFGKFDSMIYVGDSMENGVKSLRKNLEFRYEKSEFLKYWLPKVKFTDNYIEFENREGKKFGMKMFGAKTGIRGTKIFGKRPKFALLDDLVDDEDAKSKASLQTIRDTIYKGIMHALDPTMRKIVWNGTPFNKGDPLYEAVSSGSWEVNVWPICEKFPCTKEEFRGAWEERFSYEFIKDEYDNAEKDGELASFMQELMLRITSDTDKLIKPENIRRYSQAQLMQNRSRFNFYITSDFATTDKQYSDYNVICVWAYSNNKDWFLVDGVRVKQTMDKSIDDLFRLVAQYRPMNVGVEVSGQQGAFIKWLQAEMLTRNVFFTLASHGNGEAPGIRPAHENKLARFQLVLPWFKKGKIHLPDEGWNTNLVAGMRDELDSVTPLGFKSKHDDTLDNLSMLPLLGAWEPGEPVPMKADKDGVYGVDEDEPEVAGMSSYTV